MRRALITISTIVFVTACAGTIIVNVDVLSFFAAQDREREYPAPGVGLPPGLSGAVQFPVEEVELPEGFGSVTRIDTIRVSGTMDFEHETGTGTFELRIHFSNNPNPFVDPPSVLLTGTLQPGTTTTVGFDEALSQSLISVFEERSLFVGVEAELTSTEPPLGANLFGTLVLQTLVARIVGQEDAL